MYNLLGTWTPPLGLPPGYRASIAYQFALDEDIKPVWEMAGS
ncbi:MAG: hypothetical protein PHF11_07680 [Candidatus Omnitrophica bacterium]|nr:hypothetical protein [Candidatus Omnitrophota bacterium]